MHPLQRHQQTNKQNKTNKIDALPASSRHVAVCFRDISQRADRDTNARTRSASWAASTAEPTPRKVPVCVLNKQKTNKTKQTYTVLQCKANVSNQSDGLKRLSQTLKTKESAPNKHKRERKTITIS